MPAAKLKKAEDENGDTPRFLIGAGAVGLSPIAVSSAPGPASAAAAAGKMVLCMHTNTSVGAGYRGALEGGAKSGIKNVELNATLVDEFLKTDTLDGARKVLTDNGLTAVHGGVNVDGLLQPNSDPAKSIENLKRPLQKFSSPRPQKGSTTTSRLQK